MQWNYRKVDDKRTGDSTDGSNMLQKDSLMEHHENRRMFDYIAPYYDKTNRILSLGLDHYWRHKGVRALMSNQAQLILDVGAGTGDIGIKIVKDYRDKIIVGIDTSLMMMRIGLEKARGKGLGNNITLCSSDVVNLCFEANVFDGAITSFCIRNVENRQLALDEIFRVLKHGAKLVIVELTQPQGGVMKPLFNIYSKLVTPLITGIFSSVSAYNYLTESMADFPKPSDFSLLLQQAGFEKIHYFHLTFGIVTVYEAIKPT